MRFGLPLILTILSVTLLSGATYTYEVAGNWTDVSNWDIYPGTNLTSADTVIINSDLVLDANVMVHGTIIVNPFTIFTNDWVLNVHGQLINNGTMLNDSQMTLFGDATNHEEWINTEDGALIVTNTAEFKSYGPFTNGGTILGYFNSYIRFEGDLINNNSMTINSIFEIKQTNNNAYTNNGFSQFNSSIRLEGELINASEGTFNINSDANLVVSDNSKLTNLGIININGNCQLSSQLDGNPTLGNLKVNGILTVKDTIVEIL